MTDADTDIPTRHTPAPALGLVLSGHLVFTVLYAVLFVNVLWLMPMLARLRFGSSDPRLLDLQTVVVTAAVPTFMAFSIFWHEVLRRVSVRRYLLIYWLAAVAPLGCLAFAQHFWDFLVLHLIATAGAGSWTPLNGKLLKHFYGDRVRGRVFGLLNAASLIGAIASAYVLGLWIESDPENFRVFFAVTALLQLVGVGVLAWLTRITRTPDEPAPGDRLRWGSLIEPVRNIGAVLRADPTFLRYEAAFMTYGAAYMICEALVPILADRRLGMSYDDYSHSTQMSARIAMLLATLPMGWVHDRLGPMRTSCAAFATLIAFPLLLIAAQSPAGLGAAFVVWGVGLAGVQMGWMLGPLRLAGSAERVPQYVAIHATLVGVRGLVFQWLGVALYALTASFTFPLVLAALLFCHAAYQMAGLHRRLERDAATPPASGQ